MCTTDGLLRKIEKIRKTKFYKNLKPIVKYLLSEVEEMVQKESIAVNRSRKQNSVTRLFEIQFSEYAPFTIHTIYKSGAAHIKCYEECRGEEARKTINQIESVCEILEWHVETDRIGGRCVHIMKIGCFIPKEVTP